MKNKRAKARGSWFDFFSFLFDGTCKRPLLFPLVFFFSFSSSLTTSLVTSKSQHVTHTWKIERPPHTKEHWQSDTQSTTTQTQCADALGYSIMKEKFLYSSSEAGTWKDWITEFKLKVTVIVHNFIWKSKGWVGVRKLQEYWCRNQNDSFSGSFYIHHILHN